MKASERLRKAAADPSILVAHNFYFMPRRESDPEPVVCRACAVGSMVACCEQPEIIHNVYRLQNDSDFYETVKTLAPSLLTTGTGLACPLEHDHPLGLDIDDNRGYDPEDGEQVYGFMNYGDNIARLVEHLFEDHECSLTEIADLIEPLGH